MSTTVVPLTIKILGREYRVMCPAGEEKALTLSAHYLDERMQEVKNSGKVIGIDRIAVMVALNMTHELLSYKPQVKDQFNSMVSRLDSMKSKIDEMLTDTNK